jgi:hypothetical protein
MPPRSSSRPAPVPPPAPEPVKLGPFDLPAPSWTRLAIAFLAAFLLFSLFTSETGDSDTWWHLKTGQYIVQEKKLPVPDPFSWTTHLGKESYPGEEMTRRFNLTHEWLSQAAMYAAYAALDFKGLIGLRALWLTAFCFLVGLVAYQRSHSFYRSLAVSLATITVLRNFIADRPQYFTYVFLVLTIAILESRKRLWLLPPLFIVWANCHAGFVMGWVVMGAYCGESLFYRWRGRPQADERRLWTMALVSMAVSGLNPNYFNVVPVLRYYRQSPLQSSIWEWQRPKYWEISPFMIMMCGAAALLALKWRKTRPVDWMLLFVFSVSALMATRNIFLVGIWGPVLIAGYAPPWEHRKREAAAWVLLGGVIALSAYYLTFFFSFVTMAAIAAAFGLAATRRYPIVLAGIVALLLAAGIRFQIVHKHGFQFRGAMWKYPDAAAEFILKNNLKGRMFNTYGQGGYLIWRLWPHQQVFLDGRALNEKVYFDSNRIAMNANADRNSKSGEELLKDYGIDIIMMDGFDAIGGSAYYLPAALADPSQREWKLVYQDIHNVIYMRNPPPGLPVLKSLDALTSIEDQCMFWVKHSQPLCSRGMVDIFGRIGDRQRYNKWLAIYNENRGAESAFTIVK